MAEFLVSVSSPRIKLVCTPHLLLLPPCRLKRMNTFCVSKSTPCSKVHTRATTLFARVVMTHHWSYLPTHVRERHTWHIHTVVVVCGILQYVRRIRSILKYECTCGFFCMWKKSVLYVVAPAEGGTWSHEEWNAN